MFIFPIFELLATVYWKFIKTWGNLLFFHPKNKEHWVKYMDAKILRYEDYAKYDIPIKKILPTFGFWAFIDFIFAIIKALLMGSCIIYLLLMLRIH